MPKPKDTLDQIQTNNPCTADWNDMIGNDEVRFCRHCDLSVYNLSAMTRQEALRLVIASNGKLCARYIRRPNGSVRTADAVVQQLHSIKRRASRIAAGAFSAALTVSSSVVAASPSTSRSRPTLQDNFTSLALTNKILSVGNSGSIITGVVTDQNGAVIPGATITLLDQENGTVQSTTTNNEGVFECRNLGPGEFSIKIEAPGFSEKQIRSISIGDNENQNVSAALEVSGEFVTVGSSVITVPSDPLVGAAASGDAEEVKTLLAEGADVDLIDDESDATALMQAVANGNLEIVKILLNAGADVNLKTRNGRTALMNVTGSTTPDVVWALIDAGAKIDIKTEDGAGALLNAAGYNVPDVIKALLAAGATVDARGLGGRTPLIIAAEGGLSENIEVLLKAGATVNLRDDYGKTALGLAIEYDMMEAVELLKSFGGTE